MVDLVTSAEASFSRRARASPRANNVQLVRLRRAVGVRAFRALKTATMLTWCLAVSLAQMAHFSMQTAEFACRVLLASGLAKRPPRATLARKGSNVQGRVSADVVLALPVSSLQRKEHHRVHSAVAVCLSSTAVSHVILAVAARSRIRLALCLALAAHRTGCVLWQRPCLLIRVKSRSFPDWCLPALESRAGSLHRRSIQTVSSRRIFGQLQMELQPLSFFACCL